MGEAGGVLSQHFAVVPACSLYLRAAPPWSEDFSLFFCSNTGLNLPEDIERGTETDSGSELGVEPGSAAPTAGVSVDGWVGCFLKGITD